MMITLTIVRSLLVYRQWNALISLLIIIFQVSSRYHQFESRPLGGNNTEYVAQQIDQLIDNSLIRLLLMIQVWNYRQTMHKKADCKKKAIIKELNYTLGS